MASESRLMWIIFAALVALIAVPLLLWRVGEARRPVLEEVRIVTATAGDPVFRTGSRTVPPDGGLEIAAALRIGRPGGSSTWLAPVDLLEIDGTAVEHTSGDAWPEDDRVMRVFWFTVESSFLGGDLTADKAGDLLAQRSYLAPEMGRGLRAGTVPEQHNDDQINLGDESFEIEGGTFRLYVRVEVAEKADSVAAEQGVSSAAAAEALEAGFPTVRMQAAFPSPVSPAAGELFRLPGFEPRPEGDVPWDEITRDSHGASFRELVERRLVTSSRTFAATAIGGRADFDLGGLSVLGRLVFADGAPTIDGRRLRWDDEVRPGDLLEDRGQYIVLLADDGDGLLGDGDRVMHSWRRPAVVTSFGQAIRQDALGAGWLRHGG
jgi:hypothetical protein